MEGTRRRQRRVFTAEYKAEVVDLCRSSGKRVGEVARGLPPLECDKGGGLRICQVEDRSHPNELVSPYFQGIGSNDAFHTRCADTIRAHLNPPGRGCTGDLTADAGHLNVVGNFTLNLRPDREETDTGRRRAEAGPFEYRIIGERRQHTGNVTPIQGRNLLLVQSSGIDGLSIHLTAYSYRRF